MKNVAMLLAASLVGVDATDLFLQARGRYEPDPVHSRAMKRSARRQQREQAKRLARARKGVHS
jgi:hypothetical protein